jgi:hypothetical protein
MSEAWPAPATPPATPPPPHECPAPGCARTVSHDRLACYTDWNRLPRPIRTSVWTAYKLHGNASTEHQAAVRLALRWYSDHPVTRREPR